MKMDYFEKLENGFEQSHLQNLIGVRKVVENLFDEAYRRLALELSKYDIKNPEAFNWKKYKALENRIDVVLGETGKTLNSIIVDYEVKEWGLANQKYDDITNQYLKNIYIDKKLKGSFFNQNTAALNSFVSRSVDGIELSDRIWDLTESTKTQLETYLGHGIATGKSASEISRDIRNCLKDPNRLFRRVGKDGELVLSNPAKLYNPGAGVYRSSYKNALRLALNETNIAYRTADFHRREQLPFVTGISVKTSHAHPEPDMCDNLAGDYPKHFLFTGWHPNCICYSVSVMLPKNQFIGYLSTGKIAKKHFITDIPNSAKKWVNDNKDRINKAKSKPYFIRDNFTKDYQFKSA